MAVPSDWEGLVAALDTFDKALRRSKAVNVNAVDLRAAARNASTRYFESAREPLRTCGLSNGTLESLDKEFQTLLRLASGNNAKLSYQRSLRSLRGLSNEVEMELIVQFSAGSLMVMTEQETAIVDTLHRLVPTAALSYRQALADLRGGSRVSWRGTACDLREALREALDELAPDGAVRSASGFKLETGRTTPTMSQKVRFVLRSRSMPSGATAAPESTVDAIEQIIGALARSTYDRGSLDTHVAAGLKEVRQLKRYVDTVLCDLLAIA